MPLGDNNTVNSTDIAVLKNDVSRMASVFEKLQVTIEKMSEVSNSLAMMIAVHEAKLIRNDQELIRSQETLRNFDLRAGEERLAIMTTFKDGLEEINASFAVSENRASINYASLDLRLKVLEQWRWGVLGGAAAIGAGITLLAKLFI